MCKACSPGPIFRGTVVLRMYLRDENIFFEYRWVLLILKEMIIVLWHNNGNFK